MTSLEHILAKTTDTLLVGTQLYLLNGDCKLAGSFRALELKKFGADNRKMPLIEEE